MKKLTEKFIQEHRLSKEEYMRFLGCDETEFAPIKAEAVRLRQQYYGKKVYLRGLIEFTNICKNDCFYCGIRCGNKNVDRYRLTLDEIKQCCKAGYALGFRTFVLQGGEDPFFTDEVLCEIVSWIKKSYPECAVTLSVGERSLQSYKCLKEAGADRYLLRHETATKEHYEKLHPSNMKLENRMECLQNLKSLGFQVGAGFMVGSPYQSFEHVAQDLVFLQEFKPHMVGIGPFVPHHETIFKDYEHGSLELTLRLLSIVRVMLPKVLLPSTTALGTIVPDGREQGILAGANVVMPNLSPTEVRKNYDLYEGKISSGAEAAEFIEQLREKIEGIGYELSFDRGDALR